MRASPAACIVTFGCQMNVADSELMAGVLRASGYRLTDDPHGADILVVNTCTIRLKAEEKALSQIGRFLRHRKRPGGWPLVVAAGCVAKQAGERLLQRLPGIDIVVAPGKVGMLAELIARRLSTGRPVLELDNAPSPTPTAAALRAGRVKAFVTIMRGCNNHCAYCVVPAVRGPEVSRPAEEVVAEVSRLAGEGYGEVTLLGQNVNSYGKGLDPPIDFPELLEQLDRRSGIPRLRFTTSHPKDLGHGLLQAMRDLPSVCEAIHLPAQSGSSRILAAMNRGYTSDEYGEKTRRLRDAVPGVMLSTDLIVGFPGETEEAYEETLDLVGRTRFASLFAFKFSAREGTTAAALQGAIPEEEKARRLSRVLDLQEGITLAIHRAEVNTTREVLVEGPSKTGSGMLTGRTRGNLVVNFPGGAEQIGRLVNVRITEALKHSLRGEAS